MILKGFLFATFKCLFMFRLRVKLNEDRVVVLLDNKRALVDFYSPYRLSIDNAESEFDVPDRLLTIRTSIEW